MRLALRRVCSVLIAVVIQGGVGLPTARAEADETVEAARSQFRTAVALLKAGEWVGAEEHLRRALALRASSVLRYNLALALSKQGRVAEPSQLLEEALADPGIRPRLRAQCEALLSTVRPSVAQLTFQLEIKGTSAGLAFQLDGADVTREQLDRGVSVDPGTHTVRALRGSAEAGEATATVAEGGSARIVLHVAAEVPTPLRAARTIDADPAADITQPRRPVYKNPWLWAGAGAAALVAAVTGVLVAIDRGGSSREPVDGSLGPGTIQINLSSR